MAVPYLVAVQAVEVRYRTKVIEKEANRRKRIMGKFIDNKRLISFGGRVATSAKGMRTHQSLAKGVRGLYESKINGKIAAPIRVPQKSLKVQHCTEKFLEIYLSDSKFNIEAVTGISKKEMARRNAEQAKARKLEALRRYLSTITPEEYWAIEDKITNVLRVWKGYVARRVAMHLAVEQMRKEESQLKRMNGAEKMEYELIRSIREAKREKFYFPTRDEQPRSKPEYEWFEEQQITILNATPLFIPIGGESYYELNCGHMINSECEVRITLVRAMCIEHTFLLSTLDGLFTFHESEEDFRRRVEGERICQLSRYRRCFLGYLMTLRREEMSRRALLHHQEQVEEQSQLRQEEDNIRSQIQIKETAERVIKGELYKESHRSADHTYRSRVLEKLKADFAFLPVDEDANRNIIISAYERGINKLFHDREKDWSSVCYGHFVSVLSAEGLVRDAIEAEYAKSTAGIQATKLTDYMILIDNNRHVKASFLQRWVRSRLQRLRYVRVQQPSFRRVTKARNFQKLQKLSTLERMLMAVHDEHSFRLSVWIDTIHAVNKVVARESRMRSKKLEVEWLQRLGALNFFFLDLHKEFASFENRSRGKVSLLEEQDWEDIRSSVSAVLARYFMESWERNSRVSKREPIVERRANVVSDYLDNIRRQLEDEIQDGVGSQDSPCPSRSLEQIHVELPSLHLSSSPLSRPASRAAPTSSVTSLPKI